ncbi:Conserved_hypothetical protein [Hexamita inflata]|uniref:Transmembrane protein n=1 Tax=Hexamita inflata TaxID=28002 RepID=A0ABP1HM09_9EUKA
MTNEKVVAVNQVFGQLRINNYLELGMNGIKLQKDKFYELFGDNELEVTFEQQIELTQNTKLEKYLLMHVLKPLPYVDLYIVIEDNNLYIIDKDMNILQQTEINCEIYSGYQNPNLCNGQIIQEGYFSQLIICKGVIYIQILNKVCYLHNQQFELLIEIPDFDYDDTNSYYCSIFSLNDQLYIKNTTQCFIYRDNQLIAVDSQIWAFQSQNQVFMYNWQYVNNFKDGIYNEVSVYEFQVNNKRNIKNLTNVEYVNYMQNGILTVLFRDNTMQIIDLQTGDSKQIVIDYDNYYQYLHLGQFGLQFQEDLVEQYFGPQVYQTQLSFYQAFMHQQMQNHCYLNEIYQIIPFNLIFKQCTIQFFDRAQNITQKTTQIIQNITLKSQKIIGTLDIYTQKLNLILKQFEHHTNINSFQ